MKKKRKCDCCDKLRLCSKQEVFTDPIYWCKSCVGKSKTWASRMVHNEYEEPTINLAGLGDLGK